MAGIAAQCRAVAPVRTQVPGDVATAKKGKERVVVEKSMTQCNSARVCFENRVKNGGLFAKCTNHARLHSGPRCAMPSGPRQSLCLCTGGKPGWAEPNQVGRAIEWRFSYFQ